MSRRPSASASRSTDPLFHPAGYHCYYFDAVKKGYSGVAVYSRVKPDTVVAGYGSSEFDTEGRYIEARFKNLSVVSLYLPSGSSSEERQQAKFRCLGEFMPYLRALKRKRRDYVICGDWNIAHKEIDLRNWKANQKNSGFLPEERAWLDELFGDVRYVDAFREVNPDPDHYTWWSNRGQAWDEERRLAHRLPGAEPRAARQRAQRGHLQGAALFRPRAAHRDVRPVRTPPTQAHRRRPPKPWWRGWVDALRAYKHPRVLAMLFLGFSAGLPFMLVFSTLSAWLREAGIERATIGMLSWVGIIYSVKFFWAPVVDRLQLPLLHRLLGRRRSWMLLGQVGIAIGLLNMAHMSPVGHLAVVASLALLVAFSSATQDIAVDAWRIEAATVEMQGVMAAAYQLGYRIAMMVASAGALWIAADFGWAVSYTSMAVCAGVGIVTTLVISEPEVRVIKHTLAQEARVSDWLERKAHWPEGCATWAPGSSPRW